MAGPYSGCIEWQLCVGVQESVMHCSAQQGAKAQKLTPLKPPALLTSQGVRVQVQYPKIMEMLDGCRGGLFSGPK